MAIGRVSCSFDSQVRILIRKDLARVRQEQVSYYVSADPSKLLKQV